VKPGYSVEFKTILVLPVNGAIIPRNCGNYRYGNYVGNAPRRQGSYSKYIKTENALLITALSNVYDTFIVKMTVSDQ